MASGSNVDAGRGVEASMARVRPAFVLLALAMGCERAPQPSRRTARPPFDAPARSAFAPPEPLAWETIAARSLARATLTLARDEDGRGHFVLAPEGEPPAVVRCDDRLEGAWGLWIDDIDDDGHAEAIVALHKPARFDPEPHNRLHVYGFEDGRCVPAWRGTRLAGRFDAVTTDPDDRGALVVHEWLSPTRRRIARYRWQGFGYRVEAVPWEGSGPPPAPLAAALDFGPSPVSP